jgi:hypothetical protein
MSTLSPEYGGCVWPMDAACVQAEWDAFAEPVQTRALVLASATLQRLVLNRVSNCPITVRPTPAEGRCFIPGGGPGWSPSINGAGQWVNNAFGDMCEVALPGPVGRIDEVRLHGNIVHPDYYRVDNGNLLTWQGPGGCPWPASQNIHLPDTEDNTFSVTYLNAYPVDAIGAQAVAVLAVEFAKSCVNDKKCRLPEGVRTVARQGVTYDIEPGLFPDGFTSIKEVDAFITLWNPKGRQRSTQVWSPDLARRARITTAARPVPTTVILDGGDA